MELVLLLLSSLLLTTRALGASNAVLDTDGEELQRGQPYYVTSTLKGGGGLKPAARGEPCPLYVALTGYPDWLGRPLAFFPEDPNDDSVREGSTLYIMFPEPTECSESTVWKFDPKERYVSTGGTKSSAIGPVQSRFAIFKAGGSDRDYQIQVCPCSMGVEWPSCRMGCTGTLGLLRDEGNILIGVNSNRPHTIRFRKVKRQGEHSMI